MLIFIFLVIFAIICLSSSIVLHIKKDTEAAIPLVPGLFALLISVISLVASLGINSKTNAYTVKEEIYVEIINLQYDRKKLISIDANTSQIDKYNERVRMCKDKIEQNQAKLKNPFVNWYTCYVWNDFSADQVQYITYTIKTSL